MVGTTAPPRTEYETVIGLEVHAQLLTRSKMFCSCDARYVDAPPNTHVCPVCLGLPGVLPVINRQAVEYTIMTALALNCTIAEQTKFDRKNYPYPDLVKGYQISQYDMPIGRNGWLDIELDGQRRRIRINRVHLEEDTAKLFHRVGPWGEPYALVDVNRSGVPLMEIVSEPDIRSPEEARLYLVKLRSILQYLGVSSGNMEEGSFRCDANVSIRPRGSTTLSTKVEVKNMNSFRSVYRALQYEVERQRSIVESGGVIVQETRGWVEDKAITVSQRSKEYAHDYRYFPEPDLPPLVLDRAWVQDIQARLPELPDARRDRYMAQYQLPRYDADQLTASRALADYFEAALQASSPTPQRAKALANWLLGDFMHLLHAEGREIEESPVTPTALMRLILLVEEGTLSIPLAKEVLNEMFRSGKGPQEIVAEKGLAQISDADQVRAIARQVINDFPQAVDDYRSGKTQALSYLVGQVMKATRGKANPTLVNELLRELLHEGP